MATQDTCQQSKRTIERNGKVAARDLATIIWSVVKWIARLPLKPVNLGSILSRIKSKTREIGIHSFPAWRLPLKEAVWNL